MKNSSVPGQRKRAYSPPLPPGWSRWFDKTGRPYFINDEDGSTSWEDPRAPPEAILNQAVPQAPQAARMVSHQRATPSFPSPPPNPRAPQLVPPQAHVLPDLLTRDSRPLRDSPVQVHINGIDSAISEQDILLFFGQYAASIVRVCRKETYCFVHFGEDLSTAMSSVADLDGRTLAGRHVRVSLNKATAEKYRIPMSASSLQPPRRPEPQNMVSQNSSSFHHKPPSVPIPDRNSTAPGDVSLHVSGMPPSTTEQDILDFFRTFRARVLRVSYRPQQGFAFIHFDSVTVARAAIDKLNGKPDKLGQKWKVCLSSRSVTQLGSLASARPQNPQRPSAGPAVPFAEPRGADDETIQLFVGGLAPEITNDDLRAVFAGSPILKIHRSKETHGFVHVADINTALDVMRDMEGAPCKRRLLRISLSTAACQRYGIPQDPHRRPQLMLRGMPMTVTEEHVRGFLGPHNDHVVDIKPTENPGEWSVVMAGLNQALACYEALDGRDFSGSFIEMRLSDASSRCLNLPPRPDKRGV